MQEEMPERYPADNRPMVAGGPRELTRGVQDCAGYVAPPPAENRVARAITIKPLNHGFFVEVDCQKFAVESKEALLHRLDQYLSNPAKVESAWLNGQMKF